MPRQPQGGPATLPMHRPLPATLLRWLLLPLLAVMVAMALVGAPLKGPVAPQGIVSLEFCAFTASCAAILAGWTARQREFAFLGLGLDYLFLVLYPTVIAAALLTAASGLSARLRALARGLAGGMALAGLADAVENAGLVRLLLLGTPGPHTTLAAWCAALKFTLLGLALVVLVVLAGLAAWRRRGRPGCR